MLLGSIPPGRVTLLHPGVKYRMRLAVLATLLLAACGSKIAPSELGTSGGRFVVAGGTLTTGGAKTSGGATIGTTGDGTIIDSSLPVTVNGF